MKMQIKKMMLLCTATVTAFALTGCTTVKDFAKGQLEQMVVDKAEMENADSTYQKIAAESNMQDGYYVDTEYPVSKDDAMGADESADTRDHIAFATNAHLNIKYYLDADFENPIDVEDCRLSAGSSIYAQVTESNSINSDKYHFLEFRIYKWDTDGTREKIATANVDSGLVFTIPEDFVGTEISIEPVGIYEKRELTFEAYYTDENGGQHTVSDGTWAVNDEAINGNAEEISPTASYTVSYDYDEDKYFYVTASPDVFYSDADDGKVEFVQAEPTEASDENYSVELQQYISISFEMPANGAITYNSSTQNGNSVSYKKGKSYENNKLKYGDTITIETVDDCEFTYDDNNITVTQESNRRYILTVVENKATASVSGFSFDPANYSYAHGEIAFMLNGKRIAGETALQVGQKIEYKAENLDDGYWLPDDVEHTITISNDETETRKAFQNIKIWPQKKVTVHLPQPEYGGSAKYSIGDEGLTSSVVDVYCGTTIKVEYNSWSGWEAAQASKEYVIDETETQSVPLTAFTEVENHKPKLTVSLHKSISVDCEKMEFDVNASGCSITGRRYSTNDAAHIIDAVKDTVKGLYQICDIKIGTEKGITISADNDQIPDSKLLKVVVTKTERENSKNTHTEVYYIERLPAEQVIPIYDDASSGKPYSSIDIQISMVSKETFEKRTVPNAKVTVQYVDDSKKLNSGDVLDGDREVIVTISPNTGYYITCTDNFNIVDCSNIKSGAYQEKMKYSEYRSKIDKIISKHPIKKIYTVTLDTTDPYGTVTYMLNDKEVSGKQMIREEDKLEIKYVITANECKIYRSGNVFEQLANRIKSDTEETFSIPINASLDGSTIKRKSYIKTNKD